MCSALAQVAKHSVDLAEVVVEADLFPKALTCLKFPDEFVRKHAATLVSTRTWICGQGIAKTEEGPANQSGSPAPLGLQ